MAVTADGDTPRAPRTFYLARGNNHSREVSNAASVEDDSRPSTPDPTVDFRAADQDRHWNEKLGHQFVAHENDEDVPLLIGAAGRLPEEVYDRTLNWWRASIRRAVLRNVEWESKVIAAMQKRVRHPVLDSYFVYTSSLGTHTFFMIMLPIFFFFGAPEAGRGLLLMLAVGVYLSSFIKDLVCSPRPFAPPVTRLTIGNHHLEYGFPSTHSTNSVSIALLLFTLLRRIYKTPLNGPLATVVEAAGNASYTPSSSDTVVGATMISQTTYMIGLGVLLFYVVSIVFGRLYTGMHSFTDCIVGVSLGAGIWSVHMAVGPIVDAWVSNNGWIVPAVIIPLGLLLVNRHPQPVDDCPCFEDAIAFISVIMGELVSRWFVERQGFDKDFFKTVMPGSSWATWRDVATWWSFASIKTVIGILTIFVWRILAKSLFHFILPPTFRFLSLLFKLPSRRFYTPATDYTTVPPEKGLRPIPSVIDLPGMVEYEIDGAGAASTALRGGGKQSGAMDIKQRPARGERAPATLERGVSACNHAEQRPSKDEVIHYDADVLTKVAVYSGIGMLACNIIPIVFEVLGWGVKTAAG